MELNGLTFINSNSFKTGYEVEACFYRESFQDFLQLIKKLDKRIEIVTDGSIRPLGWVKSDRYGNFFGHIGREIKTFPLKSKESVQLLEEIFKLINKLGYVNFSTGLHCNYSPIDKKDYEKVNPFFLVNQPIWKNIKKSFNRTNNKYCRDVVLRKDIIENPSKILDLEINTQGTENGIFWNEFIGKEISIHYKHKNAISLWHFLNHLNECKKFIKQRPIINHWHYSVCNFTNYPQEWSQEGRIEARCFGGENYCSRLKEITHYINDIFELTLESYNHPIKI